MAWLVFSARYPAQSQSSTFKLKLQETRGTKVVHQSESGILFPWGGPAQIDQ